jgi:hypothetical protein
LMSLPRMNEKANRGKNPAARSAASTAAPLASHPLAALDPHPAGQGQREERGYRDQPVDPGADCPLPLARDQQSSAAQPTTPTICSTSTRAKGWSWYCG